MPVDLTKPPNSPSSPREDRRRAPPKRTLSDPPSEPSPRTAARRSSGNSSATTSPTGQVAESPEFSPRHIRRTSTLTRFPIKISTDVSFPTSDPSSASARSRARSVSQQQHSPALEKKPAAQPSTPPRPSVESRPSSDDFSDRSFPYSPVLEQPSPGLDFPPPLQVRPQAEPSSMSTSTKTMNTAVAPTDAPYMGQQSGGSMKMSMAPGLPVPMPNLSGQANGLVGNLLKGPIDANGKLKDAALMVGIKMDLEAEVHLTARVRGDILVGLY